MEARLGCAPNLPDPGMEAQSVPATAIVCKVLTPLKQNRELLVAGVLQPLTHVVKLARGVLGITGGRVLVTETEGLLVEIFDATVGAAEGVRTAGPRVLDTEVEGVRGALDLDPVEVATGEGTGTIHSRVTEPGHPALPQAPTPPSAPVA